jgi:hypothetical protein
MIKHFLFTGMETVFPFLLLAKELSSQYTSCFPRALFYSGFFDYGNSFVTHT